MEILKSIRILRRKLRQYNEKIRWQKRRKESRHGHSYERAWGGLLKLINILNLPCFLCIGMKTWELDSWYTLNSNRHKNELRPNNKENFIKCFWCLGLGMSKSLIAVPSLSGCGQTCQPLPLKQTHHNGTRVFLIKAHLVFLAELRWYCIAMTGRIDTYLQLT